MNLFSVLLMPTLCVFLCGCSATDEQKNNGSDDGKSISTKTFSDYKDGDIVFQDSQSRQCEAIKLATNSKWSHCGIIYIKDEIPMVFEAIQPVNITPLESWINRGAGKRFVVKRLVDSDKWFKGMPSGMLKKTGKYYMNKNYDMAFSWTDEEIYCSELVWKFYRHAFGFELCPLKSLKDYNLEHELVHAELVKRYGDAIPMDEPMISPEDIYNSDQLFNVYQNFE